MHKAVPEGTVVKSFMLGNTRIKICNDAYINKTPEEIDQILKCINQVARKCVMSGGVYGECRKGNHENRS